MRWILALVTVLAALAGSSCSSGVSAPPVSPASEVCNEAFCLDAPDGWGDEVADSHVSFHHKVAPDETFLTGSIVDTEAIVLAAGGSWPASTEVVMESFWALLDDAGEGSLIRTERMVGGAIRSWGSHSTGDMWFLLVPVEGTVAIGVEIRGPNDTWESHADAVFPTVRPAG